MSKNGKVTKEKIVLELTPEQKMYYSVLCTMEKKSKDELAKKLIVARIEEKQSEIFEVIEKKVTEKPATSFGS